MTVVQRTDLESLATALLERVDGLVESNTKLQSEVHSLQADLQAAQARLDRHGALARLGEMAAGIAHEIRNPLAGLRLYAQALHEDLQNVPESQTLVDKQLAAVDAMESIVRDVLAFAREEKINPQSCLVADLMQLVRVRCEPLAEKFDINIHFGEVPAELEAHVESELVVSALCNLIRNAVEAMHEAGTKSGLVQIEAGSDELPILHGTVACWLDRPFDSGFRTMARDSRRSCGSDLQSVLHHTTFGHGSWVGHCAQVHSRSPRAMCVCCPMARRTFGWGNF